MNLEKIMTFIKVVEANSYMAAADQMKISKAAVSKQISTLEDSLGIKLIQRTTRRLALTEAGELYYQECKRLISLIGEMNELVSTMQAEPTGELRILSNRYFAERYILPSLNEFMALYPKVKINLELAERIPDFDKEKIDLVVGTSISGPPDSIQRTIGKTRYVFCASPSYLKIYGTPKKPMDLTHHRYITHTMRKPDYILNFENNLQIHVDPILRLNDVVSMRQCAIEGIGIIKLHDYMTTEAIKKGELIEILSEFSRTEYPLYLYYAQNRYLTPKIRYFIDFLMTKLE